jgi:hypothetical protein
MRFLRADDAPSEDWRVGKKKILLEELSEQSISRKDQCQIGCTSFEEVRCEAKVLKRALLRLE